MKLFLTTLVLLSSISSTFADTQRPERPIPTPYPSPIPTPGPVPTPFPEPIPEPIPTPTSAPAPRSTVVGELVTVTDQGEVYGWGCNMSARAALEINVYLNDKKINKLKPVANLNIRKDERMGLPERACGELSGFKFIIPTEYLTGKEVKIELTGNDIFSRSEIKLEGSDYYPTPTAVVGYKTLFEVNTKVYYSNGVDAFCNVANPDQVALFYNEKLKITEFLNQLPFAMRNDGICKSRPFPKSLFATASTGNSVFFSNGADAFCGIPFPGMLIHQAAATGLNPNQIVNYQSLPSADTQMQNHGVCKIEGLFQVGADVYYSNGKDAFCHLSSPTQLGNRTIYKYESFPPQMRNDGECR